MPSTPRIPSVSSRSAARWTRCARPVTSSIGTRPRPRNRRAPLPSNEPRRRIARDAARCSDYTSRFLENAMHAQVQVTALNPGVESFIGQPRQALIDGRWVAAKSGKSFDVFDPSTGKVIARVAECEKADVDAAVAAARKAF